MRKKDTSTGKFRRLAGEIAMLLAYEVTRDMPTDLQEIETPLTTMQAPVLKGREIVPRSRSCAPATASSTACCA